ncbi:hypothetical protein POF45_26695 [Pseudomonas sp. 681]|uniref:Uncharacterized protein n=1 Tax=Pseudomonas fungipugnans TaxID=3024217 RepID=A0ABT6QVP4_9PSED|nr:hypothetical protein [Pseudomonas sp. 681]MDI2594985.1 hypothetical protein [Pseudomonas sp. 681]
MNSLAQQALANALGKALSAPTGKAPKIKDFVEVQAPIPAVSLPQIEITGPINRVMELEGLNYALEVVRSFGSSLRRPDTAAKAIANLTQTAVMMPSSYASGIKQIIDLLQVMP